MKCVQLKSAKVTGKVFVTACYTDPKIVRFFTDATSKLKSININGSDYSLEMNVKQVRPDRMYSAMQQKHVQIPEAQRVIGYEISDYSIYKVLTGARAHHSYADVIYAAIAPLLPELFADDSIFVGYLRTELDKRVEYAVKEIEDGTKRIAAKREFIKSAKKAASIADCKMMAELIKAGYF